MGFPAGSLATALAAIGLYVFAFIVARRTGKNRHPSGCGATPRSTILLLVMGRAEPGGGAGILACIPVFVGADADICEAILFPGFPH